MRAKLWDLFSGAGGAARGYQRAGFHVVGFDVAAQPHYAGDEFRQQDAFDALLGLRTLDRRFRPDVIHASPPCQPWTAYRRRPDHVGWYPELVEQLVASLEPLNIPYVVENVGGAPLQRPFRLCGSSFGLDVRRHRAFESNIPLLPPPCDHQWQTPRFAQATNRANLRRTVEVGVWRIPLETQKAAMGVDWDVTLEELSEMVPPAYTEWIGTQLLAAIKEPAA